MNTDRDECLRKDVWALGADVPLLLGEGTPLFAGERTGLVLEGKPVAGAVTHPRYRVRRDA